MLASVAGTPRERSAEAGALCRRPTGKLLHRSPAARRPGASGAFCNRRAWGKRPGPVPARACPGLGQRSLACAAAGARLDGNFDRPALAPDNPALWSRASSPEPAREPLRPLVRRGPWFGFRAAATATGTGAGERDGPSHRFVTYLSRGRSAGPRSGRAGALRRTAWLWRPAQWSWHRAGSSGSWAWWSRAGTGWRWAGPIDDGGRARCARRHGGSWCRSACQFGHGGRLRAQRRSDRPAQCLRRVAVAAPGRIEPCGRVQPRPTGGARGTLRARAFQSPSRDQLHAMWQTYPARKPSSERVASCGRGAPG